MQSNLDITFVPSLLPFPKLMKHKRGFVVLMSDLDIGVVVFDASKEYRIGTWSEEWNTSEFGDFKGSVTLSND
jgi:hypothetical protein